MVLPPGEVRLEGHFGLLAGRNMSSEGRWGKAILNVDFSILLIEKE